MQLSEEMNSLKEKIKFYEKDKNYVSKVPIYHN